MPSITNVVRRFTKQKLVYWQKTGSDKYGKPAYASPVEYDCRWEDKQTEVMLDDGRKVLSKGYILLTVPILVGSWVFLGAMTDWQALSSATLPTRPLVPTVGQGGREVILLKSTPDLKAFSTVYEAFL